MSTDRQILTPGDSSASSATPVAERKKPGLKAKAAPPADDLDKFDSDDLPPAPKVEFSPEQQAEIQRMIGAAVLASRSSQDPATAAKLASGALDSEKLPTQEAAAAMCEDMVRRGIRPRAIKTPDGWYTHREMAREKDPGVARLGGAQ